MVLPENFTIVNQDDGLSVGNGEVSEGNIAVSRAPERSLAAPSGEAWESLSRVVPI